VGDFTALGVLEELRGLAPVEAVHGNMDEPVLRSTLPERAVVEAEDLTIGLVHDAGAAAGRHERLRRWFAGCDLVAYGHSHSPELARAGETRIVNPGSPTERRRAPSHTMVVVREGRPELVHLG
jgi:putative phosphoesterase